MFQCEKYFKDSKQFFNEFQWIFKYPITKILVENCLNNFPDNWLDVLQELSNEELNKFANGELINDNLPLSLISFVNNCKTFNKLPVLQSKSDCKLPKRFKIGLSEKKQQEIYYLAELINEKCLKYKIQTIVDFGSGLGYIGQLLNYLYNYEVIGLESNLNNIKIAEKRQNSLYPDSVNKVKYFHLKITSNDYTEIENIIKTLTNDKEFCFIGLHACGDLSVNASKLFSIIPTAKLLIMVSCCYHKLEESSNKKNLINFPVSQKLKDIIDTDDSYREILHRPFLRLACQEPAKRWNNMSKDLHDKHAFYVLSRAIIELFVHKNGIQLTKCVRKATRKSQCENFESYLRDTLERYYFNGSKKSDDEEFINEIKELWKLNEEKLNAVEIYTGLQMLLQGTAESLILYDRYCRLLEKNYRAEIVAVLDNIISPRCFAIVGVK